MNSSLDMKRCLLIVCLLLAYVASISPVAAGSGSFTLPGGKGRAEKIITIYFHVPDSHKKDSPVVLVLPGAGRNARSYRDAWKQESDDKGFIVVSPSYSEEFYPRFWNYNLARMIGDVRINDSKTDLESFLVTSNPDEWIFSDFDRIFAVVKDNLDLSTEKYDLFGHSAGGQLLHRFAIFYESKQVDRILSANSGWYTVPYYDAEFPVGLINAPIGKERLRRAFAKNLVVFLGELDNAYETRGHLVKNRRMNRQGVHRLERGSYFYREAKKQAASQNADFKWKKVVVPDVGHDYLKMSVAAAKYLYGA